ncbi:MAG: hypothetical protein V1933_04055 [Candidatus Omnitrophota bacterium]
MATKVYSVSGGNRMLAQRSFFIVFFWYFVALALSFIGFFGDPFRFSKGDNLGIAASLVIMALPLFVFFWLCGRVKHCGNWKNL